MLQVAIRMEPVCNVRQKQHRLSGPKLRFRSSSSGGLRWSRGWPSLLTIFTNWHTISRTEEYCHTIKLATLKSTTAWFDCLFQWPVNLKQNELSWLTYTIYADNINHFHIWKALHRNVKLCYWYVEYNQYGFHSLSIILLNSHISWYNKKSGKKLRNNLFLNALLGIQLQQTACVGIFRLPTFISNVCCLIFS